MLSIAASKIIYCLVKECVDIFDQRAGHLLVAIAYVLFCCAFFLVLVMHFLFPN